LRCKSYATFHVNGLVRKGIPSSRYEKTAYRAEEVTMELRSRTKRPRPLHWKQYKPVFSTPDP